MLTVLTVVLNRVETIEECLSSVVAQNSRNFRHLIFDGGSTDGTLEILRDYSDRYDFAQLSVIDDSGLYDAFNQAIAHVSTEYFMFLHSDDKLIAPDVVGNIVDILQFNSGDVFCGSIKFARNGKVFRSWQVTKQNLSNRFWTPPHTGCVFNRNVTGVADKYRIDLKISSDYDYLLRLRKDPALVWRVLPFFIVQMEAGGASGFRHSFRRILEDFSVAIDNELPIRFLIIKYFSKFGQFFRGL